MKKLITTILAFNLTACAVQPWDKKISEELRGRLDTAYVISTMADKLSCYNQSLLHAKEGWKMNERFELLIPEEKNKSYTKSLATEIEKLGVKAIRLNRSSLDFENEKTRASRWENVTLNKADVNDPNAEYLFILDGVYDYSSQEGYYSINDNVRIKATLFLFEVSSGEIVGKASSEKFRIQPAFNCIQEGEVVPKDHYVYKILDYIASDVIEEVVQSLFGE